MIVLDTQLARYEIDRRLRADSPPNRPTLETAPSPAFVRERHQRA